MRTLATIGCERCALESAALLLQASDHDGTASRAYYAAFHALSAAFSLEGVQHTKHSQLEAAVHRDLIRSGRFDVSVGKALSTLRDFRARGDYGGKDHVTLEAATKAIEAARLVLDAVRATRPELDG